MDKIQTAQIENRTAAMQTAELNDRFIAAYTLVDDLVLKNYLANLSDYEVVPLDKSVIDESVSRIRLFRITRMVYERDESALYKFASVFSAAAASGCAVVTIVRSDGTKTEFYMGIRSLDTSKSTATSYKTFSSALRGQFPGIMIDEMKNDEIKDFLSSVKDNSVAAVSCVASSKNEEFIDNKSYIQGLEKLALAMQGQRYTAVIIANAASPQQVKTVRDGFENIYTQISPFASTVLSYGNSSTETDSTTNTSGTSNTHSSTETSGTNSSITTGTNESKSSTQTESRNVGTVTSVSGKSAGSKLVSAVGTTLAATAAVGGLATAGVLGGVAVAGAATVASALSWIPFVGTAISGIVGGITGGISVAAPMLAASVGAAGYGISNVLSGVADKNVSRTTGGGSEGTSKSTSSGSSRSETEGSSKSTSTSESHSTTESIANTLGITTGHTQNMQLTLTNKRVTEMLKRIDRQIERLDEFESVGMWECAAYFMSDDSSVSEAAASTYRALMSGEKTGVETSAVNIWNADPRFLEGSPANKRVGDYIRHLMHPVFSCGVSGFNIPVTPACMLSGNELAIQMGLPRKSVCGFPVVEYAGFGREVVRSDGSACAGNIKLGKIFNMGSAPDSARDVMLSRDSLAMHTFVTGSTGSGKSSTVFTMLKQLMSDGVKCLVIEPAKGEYKDVFGMNKGVKVLGTNPNYAELLRINPFKFPAGIHVLEHVDRLIEIFNVCWPMYAAMPAVLKDGILRAYRACGWNLNDSVNTASSGVFPTFRNLLTEIINAVNDSAYSDEQKANYTGALATRVKSLTDGLNGMIFCADETDEAVLFDGNTIIDLSRVGSMETKSLIMGILVMRMSEHRMSRAGTMNAGLRHVTVLEEAHNILRADTSASAGPEGVSVAAKSVEMIANSIAEMRAYGEGFIIVDQSPGAVDISALRNTNTKIIMRLPEENDRRAAGKSAGLNESQIDEISRLGRGIAVVYQNDWLEPVMCSVSRAPVGDTAYSYEPEAAPLSAEMKFRRGMLNLLLHNRLAYPEDAVIDIDVITAGIANSYLATEDKLTVSALVREYLRTGKLKLWDDDSFDALARRAASLLACGNDVDCIASSAIDMRGITKKLYTLIEDRLGFGVSRDMAIAVSQCLIADFAARNGNAGYEVYAEWRESIVNGKGGLER